MSCQRLRRSSWREKCVNCYPCKWHVNSTRIPLNNCSDNGQLGGFVFEFVDALLSFLPPQVIKLKKPFRLTQWTKECELLVSSLQESNIFQSICQYLSTIDVSSLKCFYSFQTCCIKHDQLTPSRCETMLNVISKSTKSINELCTPSVLRLIFASTTKICSSELNGRQCLFVLPFTLYN